MTVPERTLKWRRHDPHQYGRGLRDGGLSASPHSGQQRTGGPSAVPRTMLHVRRRGSTISMSEMRGFLPGAFAMYSLWQGGVT